MKAFLRNNEQFLQHVVAISNVGDGSGGCKEAYAVLVGVGQYLCHFAKAGKGRPNAEIKFDPPEGFNVGALYLHSTARNFSGISEGREIVIDFGAGYTFDDVEQPAAKKFKGSLDVLFAKYQTAQGAEPEGQKPLESADPSGQPAATALAVPTAAATAIPHAGATLPVVPDALPSPPQPDSGSVIVSEHDDPTFTITIQDGALYYNSANAKNRKIEKDFVYKAWTQGEVVRQEDVQKLATGKGTIPFEVAPNTLVWDDKHKKAITLRKFFSECHVQATSVLGCAPWSY